MFADFRFALRLLRRNPAFAFVTIATLAVGIGAATAIFSIVDAVLLRSLPYRNPDRIVRVYQTKRDEPRENHSGPDFLDYRAQSRSAFSAMAAYREAAFSLAGPSGAEQLAGVIVTPEFFDVFGTAPARGRTFNERDRTSSARPIVLSFPAWQKYFGGRESVLGSTVRLNQQVHDVVGIMPAGFPAAAVPDLWVVSSKDVPETPFPDPRDLEHMRDVHYLSVVARMRPEVTLDAAQSVVRTVASRLAQQFPASNGDRGARLLPMHDDLVGDVRPALLLLLAAVGLVLAVVAVNIASLMVARGAARQREIAVRTALGAGRRRLLRQVLSESLLLGVIGGLGGLLLATWGLDLLIALAPGDVPRLASARIDGRVFLFSATLSIIVSVLFGIVPAWNTTRTELMSVMRQTAGGGGAQRQRLRAILVASELAATVVLLVAAVLIGRSLMRLQQVDLGFDTADVFSMALPLPETEYREEARQREFFRALLPRIAALPGVNAAAAAFPRPLSRGGGGATFEIVGRGLQTGGQPNYAALAWITPDYFRVLRIPLLRGRVFTDRDTDKAPSVIVINRSMWRRFWPGEDPIGRRIRFAAGEDSPSFEIVGIVGDARTYGVGQPPAPEFYVAHAQSALPFMSVLVRTHDPAASLAARIRTEIAALDRNLAAGELEPLRRGFDEQVAPARFRTILLVFFGATALLLAGLGVYGVISYSVARRTPEIGLRLALGASPGQVRTLVMRQGLALTGAGLGVGLCAALASSRWLATLLYDVTPFDPLTLLVVVVVLLIVASTATYLPTRRAMRVEPSQALRSE